MIRTVVVCLLIVTGVQRTKTKGNVTVVEGDSVTLRCDSSEKNAKIVLVEWSKFRNKTKLAVYHSNSTHHFNQQIRMEVKDQHSTIAIQEALKSDKGWYSCIFQTFPNGKQEDQIYLDVIKAPTKSTGSSKLPAYITIGVVLAMLAIGIIFILLRYVHQRKSRVNLPNQINIILKNTSDTDNQDNKQQLNGPMATNSDCEDMCDNYMNVSLQRLSCD
ncbi:T-cell immunoreceptor with Ig and ITIM domains-like [Mustelus asterias]